MRRLLPAIAVTFLLFPALAGAIPPEAYDASEAEQKKLAAGEILVNVKREKDLHTDVIAVVDAPPADVWAVIDDYNAQKEWVPDMMAVSKVKRRDGKYKICRSGTDLPWPMANRIYDLKAWNRKTTVDGVESYVSTYDYVEDSGNINRMEGYWLVQPFGDDDSKSLVRQYTIVDLGMAVPKSFITSGTNKRLPNIIKALRKRVKALAD